MTKKAPLARSKQIRVAIADDHPVVREGISALVKSQKDMRVVSEAANGRQALQQFLRHRPDILLLDLRMPEMNGIEAIQAILKKAPEAKIIVLSTYSGDEDIYQALQGWCQSISVEGFSSRAVARIHSGCVQRATEHTFSHRGAVSRPHAGSETDEAGNGRYKPYGGREEQQGDWCVAWDYRGHGKSPHRSNPEEAGFRWTYGRYSEGLGARDCAPESVL